MSVGISSRPWKSGESPAVEADRIGHRFGSRRALADVSFSVQPGEVVGLLGPNGGGKTTLFRILATLLPASEGDARIAGCSVRREPDGARSALGVVFQRPALDPRLTVRENLIHHGHLHGLTGRELARRCEAALDTVDLRSRAGDLVQTLSGGLQRRTELAKCLLPRPSVLLLDEPTTGLDPIARREILDHLAQLSRRDGVTVLLTTHHLEEAERCERVGILHEGRLVAFDPPSRLKSSIQGDIMMVEGRDPAGLSGRLRALLAVEPSVVNGAVRLEVPGGRESVGRIMESLGDEIVSLTWGRPTLDDVFVHLTGRRLHEAEP